MSMKRSLHIATMVGLVAASGLAPLARAVEPVQPKAAESAASTPVKIGAQKGPKKPPIVPGDKTVKEVTIKAKTQ